MAALLVLGLSACGASEQGRAPGANRDEAPSEERDETPAEKGEDQTLLAFSRTGGFLGITRSLTVNTNGAALLESDGAAERFELSEEHLEELERVLAEIDWERVAEDPGDVACDDCFTYEIHYDTHHVTTTEVGPSERELADLLALIEEISPTS